MLRVQQTVCNHHRSFSQNGSSEGSTLEGVTQASILVADFYIERPVRHFLLGDREAQDLVVNRVETLLRHLSLLLQSTTFRSTKKDLQHQKA